jgi:hypothetical protein
LVSPDVTSGEKKIQKIPLYSPFFKGGEIRDGFKSKAKALPYKKSPYPCFGKRGNKRI